MTRHKRAHNRQASCLLCHTMALFLASTPHRRVVVGASPAARAALTTGNHDLYPGGYGGRKLTAFTVTPRLNTVLGGKITKRTIWGYTQQQQQQQQEERRSYTQGATTTVLQAKTARAANKIKAKKNTKAKTGSSPNSGSGGGGFGSPSTPLSRPPPTAAVNSNHDNNNDPSSSASTAGELPDDDFGTFPALSPQTLESVMGVDVFDLPSGGVPARESGQQEALPFQVLQTIRGRHGLPEFAGGRRLLDAAYGTSEEIALAERALGQEEEDVQRNTKSPAQQQIRNLADDNNNEDNEDNSLQNPRPLLFPGLRLLHAEPPVVGIDDFFTPEECDRYVALSSDTVSSAGGEGDGKGAPEGGPHMQRSATLGADVDAVAQRTSTTWFHRYAAVPELMAKASALVGIPFAEGRWEEAQTVRYRPSEKFTWHLDALPPSPELVAKGGQRIATLLVYLTELSKGDGGATAFRDLGPLRVQPRKGSALLFFPSCGGAPGCPFDIRTLHAGEVVRPGGEQDKWIAQLWLRESRYTPTVPRGNEHASAESIVVDFDQTWRAHTLSP